MAEITEFNSLEDIERQKNVLKAKIEEKDKNITKMWNGLFHEKKSDNPTPSARMTKMISLGSGIFDGALLGWKLYRKFKR